MARTEESDDDGGSQECSQKGSGCRRGDHMLPECSRRCRREGDVYGLKESCRRRLCVVRGSRPDQGGTTMGLRLLLTKGMVWCHGRWSMSSGDR